MCLKERKTVQLNVGFLLPTVTAPSIGVGTDFILDPDIYYFTNQLETWKILSCSIASTFFTNITDPNRQLDQASFRYWLEFQMMINNVDQAYEKGDLPDPLTQYESFNTRQIAFSEMNFQYDFSHGNFIASGINKTNFKYFYRTIGTGITEARFGAIITFELEKVV